MSSSGLRQADVDDDRTLPTHIESLSTQFDCKLICYPHINVNKYIFLTVTYLYN